MAPGSLGGYSSGLTGALSFCAFSGMADGVMGPIHHRHAYTDHRYLDINLQYLGIDPQYLGIDPFDI